jgi:hypothetical protein
VRVVRIVRVVCIVRAYRARSARLGDCPYIIEAIVCFNVRLDSLAALFSL